MKLSKNKINKIKLKKHQSRKQYYLKKRTNDRHDNSKKKNPVVKNLRNKTVKIYTGSGNISSDQTESKPEIPSATTSKSIDVDTMKVPLTNISTNVNANAANTLGVYTCDPDNINIDVPDNIDDAETKYNDIYNSFLVCTSDDDDKRTKMLQKWYEYVSKFEETYKKLPDGMTIRPDCMNLFVGNMNYNNIPDNKEDAKLKLGKYMALLEENYKNKHACADSIQTAIDYYLKLMELKYPDVFNEDTTEEPAPGVTEEPAPEVTEEPAPEVTEEPAPEVTEEPAPGVTEEPAPEVTEEPAPGVTEEPAPGVTEEPAPEVTEEPAPGVTEETSPFTDSELKVIYNKYKIRSVPDESGNIVNTIVPFTRKNLVQLLISKDTYGTQIRRLFGLPDNVTLSQFNTGTDINKIFATILTTLAVDSQNNSAPLADENNISFEEFKKFVQCGTYRDKTTADFNCKNIKTTPDTTENGQEPTQSSDIPMSSASSESTSTPSATPQSATPQSTTTTEPNISSDTTISATIPAEQNVELNINEQSFNDSLKRVDISVFVPINSKVIVRDYAKDSAQDIIAGIGTYP